MSDDEPTEIERRDEWALADLDAAIGIVGATVGAAFGPLGSILSAFVGPYAKLAVARFMELRTRVQDEVGLEEDELRRRLDESDPLAQMIAEVVRGTVESDLEAKRRLLARAAIRALQDDAVVDEEAVFVRASNAIDTMDVRVLALIGEHARAVAAQELEDDRLPAAEVERRWPAMGVAPATTSALTSAGLIESPATYGGAILYRLTAFGDAFLTRLLAEGLEDELRRGQSES